MFLYILILLSFILYINSLFCEFAFDDLSAVSRNKDVIGNSSIYNLLWNDYWGTPMTSESSHKSYRPFTVATFRLNYFVFGANSSSYHLINVLLYCVVSYLVFQFYKTIIKICFNQHMNEVVKVKGKSLQNATNHYEDEQFLSFTAALLFVVHPIHTEAVTGVVGRAELLSTIFFILSILCFLKNTSKHMVIFVLLCILAITSKEQGISALPVCVFLDIVIVNKLTLDEFCLLLVYSIYSPRKVKYKPLLLRTLFVIGFIFVLLVGRFQLMKGELPHFTAFDNPASVANFPARHLTYHYLLSVNQWLLFNPNHLLCDWTMGTIPLLENFNDFRNLATVCFWIFYIASGFRVFFRDSISKLVSLSVAIVTFSFLPASNLFFPVGFVIAERVLFLPSIGFCLLISIGLWILRKVLCKRFVNGIIIFIVFSHSLKTVHRNTEWRSEETLFRSGLQVTQSNAKIWNNVGHVYESREMWSEALIYFNQAVEVQPNDIGSHMNVAKAHENLGNVAEAELSYRKAKALFPKARPGQKYQARVAPAHLQVFIKLAHLVKDDGRLEEANDIYEEVIRLRSSFFDAHMNRGDILLKLNRPNDALLSYRKALSSPGADKSDVYFNMGVVHSAMGNVTGAVEAYTYAIAHNPNNVHALINSAVIFEETRKPDLLARAKSRVERALQLEPDNLYALSLLGSIHMDAGRNEDAIKWWKKSLAINETYRVSLFNLALIYSRMDGKEDECLDAVRNLLRFHPRHVKGLLLHADHMLNKRKDVIEAMRIYSLIKEIDPDHLEANHNYCVALVEGSKLKEAEACLLKVYQMAPNVDYVQDNLALVQRQLKLLEFGARSKQEKQLTNFKTTRPAPQEDTQPIEHSETSELKEEDEEQVIYVAKPMRKKKNPLEEAQAIRDKLARIQSESVETRLKEAKEAVEKLKEIKRKAREKTTRECGSNEKVDNLKELALKALDDMESQLE